MNKNYYILTFILYISGCLLLGISPAFAQKNDAAKKSEIRDKAYTIINKGYDAYANVNNEKALSAFLRLFVDEEVPVYNDLLGLSYKRTLPVGDYARLLANNQITTKRVHIKNLQMEGDPVKTDNGWNVVVSFDKEISYYNTCGIYFSSREFYDSDYHLTATLHYDEFDGQCRISRIDGTIPSSNMLPMDFVVLKQTSNRDLQLNYHQQPVVFNSSQQAILSGSFDSRGFSHPKYDASRLSAIIDNCNIVTMKYLSASNKYQIKPHLGIGLGDALTVNATDIKDTSSSSMNFGIDLGYLFLESEPIRLSAFVGVGITTSSIELGYNAESYTTKNGADIDNDKYDRHYKDLSLSQTLNFTYFSIPLYLDAEYAIASGLSFYADLGLRVNFHLNTKANETSGTSGDIYGIYNRYGDLKLDDTWGFNGFKKKVDFNSAEVDEVTGSKNTTIDFLGGLGFRYDIPSVPLSVDLGVSCLMGISEMFKQEVNSNSPAIVYNTLSGDKRESMEHVNLHGHIESVKQKTMSLNIGLIYKF